MQASGARVQILFLGDTAFGENYQARQAARGRPNVLEAQGYDHSLAALAPLLRGRDLVVANLETPLTPPGPSPLAGRKKYIHWGDPERGPETLRRHGVDVVSLANNHALDYGPDGLPTTLEALARQGIEAFGAGPDAAAACTPWRRTFDLDGSPLDLVVCGGKHKRREVTYPCYASDTEAGINAWTEATATAQIAAARAAAPEAVVVAYPHWGLNYKWRTDEQSALARALVDAGADVVIGHGAHMVQEIERYRGRWIIYSLGNFVFNSPGRYQKHRRAIPYSLAAVLDITRPAEHPRARLRLYPIYTDNRVTGYQSRLVSEPEAAFVRETLMMRSPDADALGRGLAPRRDDLGPCFELELGSVTAAIPTLRAFRTDSPPRPALVEAIDLAAQFLVRACEPDGRFRYRVNLDPTVRVPPRYNLLRHAGSMYALATFQDRTPDPAVAEALERSRAFLVERSVGPVEDCDGALAVWSDPAIIGERGPRVAKLGGAGIGLVALTALERVVPSSTPLEVLQGLARFVQFMQKEDGSFHSKFIPTRDGFQHHWTSLYYPGEAALGLVMLHEIDGRPEWLRSAAAAITYLARARAGKAIVPADHWALLATARLLPRHDPRDAPGTRAEFLDHATQICESILREQVWHAADARLVGGFAPDGRTTPTSTRLEGLLAELEVLPDEAEEQRQRLRSSVRDGLQFLLAAQVRAEPHAGGFPRAVAPLEPADARENRRFNRRAGEIRIDYVQHALSAMMQYVDALGTDLPASTRAAG